jgi:beta-mannosidase
MPSPKVHIELDWRVGHHDDRSTRPQTWCPAKVPGAVQLDYAKAHNWPPYWYDENFKQYTWMEDEFWTYRSTFAKPKLKSDERLFFISKGIDYEFSISLNGEEIFYQEGMFKPVELDLTDVLSEENELRVTIFPAPKSRPEPVDKTQADQSVKPAVSYGWDWHPRLIPLGIWDETFLHIRKNSYLTDVHLDYTLSEDLKSARIRLAVQGEKLIGKTFRWTLFAANETIIFKTNGSASENFQLDKQLDNIELWWPHDHGRPALYTSRFELLKNEHSIDQRQFKIGFRQIHLVMNDGAWDEPSTFPKTRSVPPIQLEINGRAIFAKGSNWVPPEIFPGIITKERYEELIDLAVEANFNILRIWGGGFINKESFYELCDEKGILVWQDFPLACNDYKDTPKYLSTLDHEATAIIKRIRQHACLALWCGGNELFNNWSRMTDQSRALRLLNSLCLHYDPKTPFIASTPLMGMGHGHYVFYDKEADEEVFQVMNRARNTAYTEFGMPSPSNLAVLKSFIPEDELWPPKPGGVWESHHAFNAWLGDTWLMRDVIEKYFGPCENLEQLVEYGQILQCEGYKAIFEEARRQKPYCAMALNWCYNEPWPTAANNSLLNWPGIKKPAFEAVKQACRPVTVNLKAAKFAWSQDENFEAELWLLNDSAFAIPAGQVSIHVEGERKIELNSWEYSQVPANQNLKGPRISINISNIHMRILNISLHASSTQVQSSSYTFMLKKG